MSVFIFYKCIYAVAGSTGYIRYYTSFLTGYLIYERGFSRIWSADYSNAYYVLVLIIFIILGKILKDCIKQVAGTVTVYGGNSYRVAKSKIIELIECRIRLTYSVAFIYTENHRSAAFLQHHSDIMVCCDNSAGKVCYKYYNISRFYR